MWFSLKCFRSSSRMAEMAFTMISLCRLTSTPSFMLCSTVVLRQSQPKSGFHPDVIYSAQTSFTFTFHLTMNSYPFKNAANSNVFPFIISSWRSGVLPVTNAAPLWRWTYGISSGSTSARMLIESVLALEVGAAASRIFSSAIWWFQKKEWTMKLPPNMLP